MISVSSRVRLAGAELLAAVFFVLWSDDLWAQGLPVNTGSHLPVALWFVGTGVLGLVLVYAIWRNRGRTRAQRQSTEHATERVYSETERDRRRSGDP